MIRLSDALHAFAAHRLQIDEGKVMDVWVEPQYFPADMVPHRDNPIVEVFCSHLDRTNHRQVQFFTIKYRELVASLITFADKVVVNG